MPIDEGYPPDLRWRAGDSAGVGTPAPPVIGGHGIFTDVTVIPPGGPYAPVSSAVAPATVGGSGSIFSAGPDPVWDAAANGIICDGVTDQIVPLQALVDKLGAQYDVATFPGPHGSKKLWIPGFIAISSPLLLRGQASANKSHGLEICGPGRLACGLVQLTNSTSVIKTNLDNIHHVHLHDFGLRWANPQTTAHTGSYGIEWNHSPATTGAFDWHLARLQIDNPYVGLGATTQPVPWGCLFDDIVFTNVKHKLIDFSQGPSSPMNVFRKIKHLGVGGTPTGDAIAIDFSGANEITMDGLDLEDWAFTTLLYVSGGAPVDIRGVHIERWTGSQAGQVFEITNGGPTILVNVTVTNSTPNANNGIQLISSRIQGRLIVDGIRLNGVTIANSGGWKTLDADSTSLIWVRAISQTGGTAVSLVPIDATTLAATIQDNAVFGAATTHAADVTFGQTTAPAVNPRLLTVQATAPTIGSPGAGVSAQSVIAGSSNTALQVQATLTAVAPGVVIGVVAFNGGPLASAPKQVICSLGAPTAGVAAPPVVGADTFTTSGFTLRSYGPTVVTTGTYIINCLVIF